MSSDSSESCSDSGSDGSYWGDEVLLLSLPTSVSSDDDVSPQFHPLKRLLEDSSIFKPRVFCESKVDVTRAFLLLDSGSFQTIVVADLRDKQVAKFEI